jgi:hypothetical protein
MFRHLNRLTSIASARNYAITKNLFASASVLAENKDPGNVIEKSQDLKKHRKSKSKNVKLRSYSNCCDSSF